MANSNIAMYGSIFWERLNSLFSKQDGRSNEPDEQPRHKGVLIGMCIVFSVLLWFFSSMGGTYTKLIDMDSTVENISADEAFVTLPPRSIQAEVQGEGLKLMQLYYNPPHIVIDASGDVVNFRNAVDEQLPQGLDIVKVFPSEFALNKETRVHRKIPVTPRTSISWPPTHDLVYLPKIYPDSVEVSGAKTIIDGLTEWPTVPFERHDLMDTLTVSIPLSDSLKGLVDLDTKEVRFTAIVEEFTEGSRELDVMVTEVPSSHDSVALEPPLIEVFFRVPLSHYERAMKAPDFFASVPYNKIRDDTTGFVEPDIELPQGILFVDVYPVPNEVRYYDLLRDE